MAAHDARNTNRTSSSVPDDPTEEWRREFDAFHRTPVVADGSAYVLKPGTTLESDAEPTVYALDAATGEEEWTERLPEERAVGFGLAVGDGAVVYDTEDDSSSESNGDELGRLVARESESGDRRWRAGTPDWGWPTIYDGTVFAAGYRGDREGWVGAFEGGPATRNGTTTWTHRRSDRLRPTATASS